MKQYLGFDVGGTSIKVGVVEENARVVYHEKLPIPPDYDAFMEQLSDCYHRLKKEYPTLCGIGISSCGGINPATGVVFAKLAPSLTYLIGREYYKLREMVDVPVALEKDGNCAALCRIAHEAPIEKFVPQLSDGLNAPEDYLPLIEKQDGSLYAIARKDNDELIGAIGVQLHPDLNEKALIYCTSDACKGMGFTKEAVTLFTDWALRNADTPYLVLAVDENNASAARLAEKCGFTLSERRVTVSHRLLGMTGDTYLYFRKY